MASLYCMATFGAQGAPFTCRKFAKHIPLECIFVLVHMMMV